MYCFVHILFDFGVQLIDILLRINRILIAVGKMDLYTSEPPGQPSLFAEKL